MNVSCGRLRCLLLAVDLVRAVDELEQVAERADGLGQPRTRNPPGFSAKWNIGSSRSCSGGDM